MGCFSLPQAKKELIKTVKNHARGRCLRQEPRALSEPRSGSTSLLLNGAEASASLFGYSGPLLTSTISKRNATESTTFSRPSSFSNTLSYDCEDKNGTSLPRISSNFGGRPQPLPLPAADHKKPAAEPSLPQPLPAPEDATTTGSCTRSCRYSQEFRFTSDARLFRSDNDGIGSWSSRRGTESPVRGLPLPSASIATKLVPNLQAYDFHDLEHATRDFAPECCLQKGEFGAVYRAWIKDPATGLGTEMSVFRLPTNGVQGVKDWRSEVQLLSQLPDANICMVKGYCAHEPESSAFGERSRERLLVFDQSPNGSLYDYLFGSRCNILLDWTARINIIIGAARGLMYLHDRAPRHIVYREFTTSSVLLDKDFTPRLAGYGMTVTSSPVDMKSSFATTLKISQTYAKSNVWSFGVVLLELLTGKYSRDTAFYCDEKNFVQWVKPFIKEESRLSLITDTRIKGKCPKKGAVLVAMLALQCVREKEAQRPTMSVAVDALQAIKAEYCFNGGDPDSSIGTSEMRSETDCHQLKRQPLSGMSPSKVENTLLKSVTSRPTCAVHAHKIDGRQGLNLQSFTGQIETF